MSQITELTRKVNVLVAEWDDFLDRITWHEHRLGIKKYNPSQPRHPAGTSEGGRWRPAGGNSKPSGEYDVVDSGEIVNDGYEEKPASPDDGNGYDYITPELVSTVVGLTPAGRGYRIFRSVEAQRVRLARSKTWEFGKHKSTAKWNNRMKRGGWTKEQIEETIFNGETYEAPNKVNPGNTATRYENKKTGNFLVLDDETNEILQLGRSDFGREE